jgi:hypothetical protein
MARRKHLAQREPNGRIKRQPREIELPAPAETRRMRDMAAAGVRDPEWGSMLGRLYLVGHITETQYNAGRRWSNVVADYSMACCSPPIPRTAALDPSGGAAADPDTDIGKREARRHARIVEIYLAGAEMLKRAGTVPQRVVSMVCEKDLAPAGFFEVEALRVGLQTLAAFWSLRNPRPKPKRHGASIETQT